MFFSAISGFATGTLLGLLGGGGSVVAVPILVYCLGLEAKRAIGTSLAIVGLASLIAAWSYYRKKSVAFHVATVFGVTGALGSLVGARMAQLVPDGFQLSLFAVVMLLVALLMFRHKQSTSEFDSNEVSVAPHVVLASGFAAGGLTGFIGVGGGFIIVPIFTILLRMPINKAVGTSLLVVGVNSVVGAISYVVQLEIDTSTVPFALTTLLGSAFAGHFAHHIPQKKLKFGFAASLILLSVWMLAKQLCN